MIDEILKGVQKEQRREQKGAIQYLVVSFLRISLHQDNIIFRIEVFDDGFYLDRKEISRNYFPSFLQKRYSEDLSGLYKDAGRKFIRLQEYELLWIKEQYTHYYEAIVYRMIENLSRLIMWKVEESSISVTDDFKIIYGEFMDKAVILYTKGKDKINALAAFRIKDLKRNCIVGRLDFVESLLRRGIQGVKLTEVKMAYDKNDRRKE